MTRPEFDAWIEEHYTDLLKVARRRGGDADVVQAAVLQVLSTESYLRIYPPRPGDNLGGAVWTWMVNAVRGKAKDARRGRARAQAVRLVLKRDARAGLSHGWKRSAPRAE